MAKKVIQKEKNNTTYLDTYGWVLYKRGKLKEAAKVMEDVINSGEKPDAEWYEHYGFILKKQKKCSKAIENWNIALKIDSTKTNLLKEIENCVR
jgi:Tfp pilus assembly protein PilF